MCGVRWEGKEGRREWDTHSTRSIYPREIFVRFTQERQEFLQCTGKLQLFQIGNSDKFFPPVGQEAWIDFKGLCCNADRVCSI